MILGAGHNGVILQAYLAARLRRCHGRRPVAGGGPSTLEDPRHPGFLDNTDFFFQRAITAMPWYGDPELERHGASYIEPELNVALSPATDARWNGGPICTDDRIVCRLQPPDADTLRRWHDEFVPIVRDILAPEGRSPPLPPEEAARCWEHECGPAAAGGEPALGAGIVEQEFEHPIIKAGLRLFNGLREVDLRLPGFGHQIAAPLGCPAKAHMSCWRSARSPGRWYPRWLRAAAKSG